MSLIAIPRGAGWERGGQGVAVSVLCSKVAVFGKRRCIMHSAA